MRKDKDGRNLLSFGYPVYESDTSAVRDVLLTARRIRQRLISTDAKRLKKLSAARFLS